MVSTCSNAVLGTNFDMSCRFLIVLAVVLGTVFAAKNSPCTTPNGENVKCVPVSSCQVILDAIKDRNASAVKFAQDSQCGFETEPLVCCGSTGFPIVSSTTPDIFSIFTMAPVTQSTTTTTLSPDQKQQQQVILADFNTKALPDRTVCGIEKERERVIGGTITELEEFPWMAALEYENKFTQEYAGIRCGGSLINNRYVLTAAHCLINREFSLIGVRLGEWNTTSDPDCIQLTAQEECADNVVKLKIKQQIPHPFYSKKSGNNDMGLVRLERDITFTDYIRPICMPPTNLPPPNVGAPMTVAGWGATENGTSSELKLKVEVPLLVNNDCSSKLASRPVSANQLCAGGVRGKDSCQGDSGGPLMRQYEDSHTEQTQWYQEGVVSWGVGCGRADYPAIYTRVNRYITWIIHHISEE